MKRQDALLTLALVLLAIFATAFAMINYTNSVKVWPLMSYHPLTLVIAVSFVLGASVGALLVSLLNRKRTQAFVPLSPDTLPAESIHEQEQAGRR
jgi:uncharacterized integral membrane protein